MKISPIYIDLINIRAVLTYQYLTMISGVSTSNFILVLISKLIDNFIESFR